MILIIRSGTHEHFDQVYRECPKTGGVAILLQPQFAQMYAERYPEAQIFTFPKDSMFRVGEMKAGWFFNLRKKRFSEIILLYNNPNKQGYEQLELLAAILGAPIVTGIHLSGRREALAAFRMWPLIMFALLSPVAAFLPLALGAASLLSAPLRRAPRKFTPPAPGAGITILLPNFNGKHLLKEFLPSVIEQARVQRETGREVEIIVVDDASNDGGADYLRENFPEVKVLELKKNLGFPGACNHGIRAAKHDLLFLLNTDIKLEGDILGALLPHFEDPLVFSASPQVLRLHDRAPLHLRSVAFLENGKFYYIHEDISSIVPGEQFVPIGCATLFDLRKVKDAGMLDALYSPFYAEDTDLGYQAHKRGWKIIYEPRAAVLHESRSTIGKHYSDDFVKTIIERNHILFVWKNITDFKFLRAHCFASFKEASFKLSTGDKTKAAALAGAISRLGGVMLRRVTSERFRARTDMEIVAHCHNAKYIASAELVSQLRSKRSNGPVKKILLVLPRADKFAPYIPSCGLASIAGELTAAGYIVKVLDFNIAPRMPSLHEVMRDFEPDAVGFSAYTSMWRQTSEMIDYVYYQGIPVIIGGPHATLYSDDLREDRRVRYIVRGEAEDVIVSLMGRPMDGTDSPEIVNGAPSDVAGRPVSDYRLFINHEHMTVYPLVTSRGCPYDCSFCAVDSISSRKWRHRPLEDCVAELRLARERYPSISKLNITDSSPSQNLSRFKKFIEMYIEEKCPWSFLISNMRADKVDGELLELLKKAGCSQLSIGVEHGDPAVFEKIGKSETLDDIRRAGLLIKKHGIKLGLCFVIGLPHDSLRATMKSVQFAKELNPDVMFWNMLHPFKGTPAYDWYKENGSIYDAPDFSSYDNYDYRPAEPCVEHPDFSKAQMKKAHFIAKVRTGAYITHGLRERAHLALLSLKYGCLLDFIRRRGA